MALSTGPGDFRQDLGSIPSTGEFLALQDFFYSLAVSFCFYSDFIEPFYIKAGLHLTVSHVISERRRVSEPRQQPPSFDDHIP